MSDWVPYFKPTRRVHESGFRCFECGYLKRGEDGKIKKVVISDYVDAITNGYPIYEKCAIRMDMLKEGYIIIFGDGTPRWNITFFGSPDAIIVDDNSNVYPRYEDLDKIWKEQNKEEK